MRQKRQKSTKRKNENAHLKNKNLSINRLVVFAACNAGMRGKNVGILANALSYKIALSGGVFEAKRPCVIIADIAKIDKK